jgi:hypothetical protein
VKTVLIAALVHAIVHLRPENPPAPPLGYVHTVNGVLPIASPLHDPRLDAVLVLEPAEAGRPMPPPPAAPVEVRIYGGRALPEIITAAPTSQVTFRNDDRRPLTLSCPQAKELFPSAPLPPAATLGVTPPGPGQFELRSFEYPHLRATLLVTSGAATRLSWTSYGQVGVAQLDVPEGTYKARLFFLHRYVATQDVTVTAQGSEFVLHAVWPAVAAPQAP